MDEAVKDFFLKNHGQTPLEMVSSECQLHVHFFLCIRSKIPNDGLVFLDAGAPEASYLVPIYEYEFSKN